MSGLRDDDHVIVVGAGLAGWRFVESLRREGFSGSVTMVGDEDRAPYDRPPLSKQCLSGKWPLDRVGLASGEQLRDSRATVRLGQRVTGLDVDAATVRLDDGAVLTGSHVVLAVGARARPLAFASWGPVDTLRTYDDAERLGRRVASLSPGDVVGVIGGGFLGAEIATSLRARGLRPIVFEAAAEPLLAAVGPEAAHWLHRLAGEGGVELRTSQRLVDVAPSDGGATIDVGDASIEVAAVVAAVGSSLDLDWLEGSGIPLDDGVVVDGNLLASPRVAAIGDVARFPMTVAGVQELVRVEHWQVATEHAARLARHWMNGESDEVPMVPYFWSDQYGKKIQMLGHPDPSDHVVRVSGDPDDGRWLALYSRREIVTGALALSHPRALMLAKVLLDSPTSLGDALERAPWAH